MILVKVLSVFFVLLSVVLLLSLWFKWVEMQNANLDRETTSSFECGFDGKDVSRLPFSLRFFLMMILFIIFDVEICILLQLPYEIISSCYSNRVWFVIFMLMMGVGVLEENRRGVLNWKDKLYSFI